MRQRLLSARLGSLMVAAALLVSACTFGDSSEEDSGDLGPRMPTFSFAHYASDIGPTYEQGARVLAEEFEQLGLDIRLEPVQFNTFVDQITVGGQLEDMALGSWGGDPDRLDPNIWVIDGSTCEGYRNSGHWCDQAYDEIALEQGRTLDQEERKQLVWQAQEEFQSKLPWWQVSHEVSGMLYNSDRWENVTDPAPIPPHETVLHPWLQMRPTGDDRILDWAHYEYLSTYNILTEEASRGWLRFIYDTFLRYDGGEIVPWAAESWRVVDDTTVELTLRDGMSFHDGEPVTADDAVFTVNYLVEWEPSAIAAFTENIEGAEKVDDLTFRINLTQPDAAIFGQALTSLPLLPQHIWADVPESVDASDPGQWNPIQDDAVIGSGPFVFESWRRNQSHVLSTNTQHWAAPDYDGIRLLALGQADAVRTAMQDGTADLATEVIPAATMEDLAGSEDHLDFVRSQSFNTTMVLVNHQKRPFDDYAFRRALRLATNKERVVLEGWLGYAEPAGLGNVPRALGDWHNPELEEIPYDIDQARQVLEDAGYGWDSDGRLHFPPSGGGAS